MEYSWSGTTSGSHERLSLTLDGAVRAQSCLRVGPAEYEFDMLLDSAWVFQTLRLRTSDSRRLDLRRSGSGHWTHDGTDRADLNAAVDIDLAFSPFTNTLPIRRLDLLVGSAADIVTAYVDAPSLAVVPEPQRYTRLDVDRYLFESLDGDFSREIIVDADGLVIDYPGLFTRHP